jgi:tetratricopeptide (TPR) repeat protein
MESTLDSLPAREDLMQRIEAAYDTEVLAAAIDAVKTRVKPHTWRAFEIVAFERRTGHEAAEELGISTDLVYAARRNVQKMLQETVARARAAAVLTAARAEEAAAAARSMDHLTGDLIEKMVLRSNPDDAGHIRFLQSLREEFSNWPLGADPEAGLRFRLRGLRRIADLFYDVSQHDDAVACHRLSLAVLDEMAALRPADPEVLRERLASMRLERSSLYHLGRNDEAEALARSAIALLDDSRVDMPGKELARIEHALDLGTSLHEQGRIDEGKEQVDEALAGFRRLRQARPEDVDLAARETHALYCSQLSLFNAERFAECRQQLEQLVGQSGGFLASHPADAIPLPQRSMMTKLVSIGHAQLGRLAADEGRLDEAITHVLRQRDLCAAFVAELPAGEIDPIHKEVVDADLHAATLLDQAGRDQEAMAAVKRAETAAKIILENQPGVWDHAAMLGGILWRRGELAREHGDQAEAAARYREIIALLEPWKDTPACREKTAILLQTAEAALAHCLAN